MQCPGTSPKWCTCLQIEATHCTVFDAACTNDSESTVSEINAMTAFDIGERLAHGMGILTEALRLLTDEKVVN